MSYSQLNLLTKEVTLNIIVLVKQVIDVELNIRVKDNAVVEDGLTYVISNWDEIAIECALQMVEESGGEITLVTIGPDRAADALRKGLAMGAHKAIHINDSAFDGSDSFVYAKALEKLLEGKTYDLVIGGKQAQDTDAGLTTSMLAEFLQLPQVSNVAKVAETASDKLIVHRKGDNGNEVVEVSFPAVLTVNDSLNEPRLASLRGIMQAKKKPIETMDLASLGLEESSVGATASPTSVVGVSEPEGRKAGQKFEGDGEEVTKNVIDLLVNEAKILS